MFLKLRLRKNIFAFSIISLSWDDTNSWNLSSQRTMTKGCLNTNMQSYQYGDSNVKDKTVSPTILSLTWETPYLGNMVFILRWPVVVLHSQTMVFDALVTGARTSAAMVLTMLSKNILVLVPHGWTLLCLIALKTWINIWIWYHIFTMKCKRLLKFAFKENKHIPISHNLYHNSWWPGNNRS